MRIAGWLLVLVWPLWAAPLHDAVNALDLKRAETLLQQGEAIDAVDARGETPMHLAARYGRLSMVRLLLKHHPDLYVENRRGYTPLGIAIARNHIGTIELILDAQQRQSYHRDIPPLHRAAASGDLNGFFSLLRDGFGFDTPDGNGVTPLHLAAREGHAMMVQLLLYWGANPDARDNEGRDALYYARYGNHRIIETMILKARKRKRAKK